MTAEQFTDATEIRAAGAVDANLVVELTGENGVFDGSLRADAGMAAPAPVAASSQQTGGGKEDKKQKKKRGRDEEALSIEDDKSPVFLGLRNPQSSFL